ncbi:MAG: PEP-CTERM sorting domain-containing protein [Planctomycetota bacterium]|nr:PEP-CTERM sorting domain-containing protein [Planctomycetota bacterium]MDA1213540.1 PEP-CTERM sorting domain-containing protein [Planctomycetota bacterium]
MKLTSRIAAGILLFGLGIPVQAGTISYQFTADIVTNDVNLNPTTFLDDSRLTGTVIIDDAFAAPNTTINIGSGLVGFSFVSGLNPQAIIFDFSDIFVGPNTTNFAVEFGPGGIAPDDIIAIAWSINHSNHGAFITGSVVDLGGGNFDFRGTIGSNAPSSGGTKGWANGIFSSRSEFGVPEPGTLSLVLIGMVGLAGYRRRGWSDSRAHSSRNREDGRVIER